MPIMIFSPVSNFDLLTFWITTKRFRRGSNFTLFFKKKPDKAKEITEDERVEKEKHRREELRKQKEKRDRRKKRIAEGRDTSSEEDEESLDGNIWFFFYIIS